MDETLNVVFVEPEPNTNNEYVTVRQLSSKDDFAHHDSDVRTLFLTVQHSDDRSFLELDITVKHKENGLRDTLRLNQADAKKLVGYLNRVIEDAFGLT